MFNINDVIKELEKCNPNGFINETHFQVEFGYAVKRTYPKYKLTFEWKYDNYRIDLLAENGDERIAFEFKYFTKAETRMLNHGLKVQLKNQANKDLHRIGFWRDVAKLQSIPNLTEKYCLFLTNDETVFNETKNGDREFDVSDGIKPTKLSLRHYHRGGQVDNEYEVKLTKKNYTLKHVSYGSGMWLLLLPV